MNRIYERRMAVSTLDALNCFGHLSATRKEMKGIMSWIVNTQEVLMQGLFISLHSADAYRIPTCQDGKSHHIGDDIVRVSLMQMCHFQGDSAACTMVQGPRFAYACE